MLLDVGLFKFVIYGIHYILYRSGFGSKMLPSHLLLLVVLSSYRAIPIPLSQKAISSSLSIPFSFFLSSSYKILVMAVKYGEILCFSHRSAQFGIPIITATVTMPSQSRVDEWARNLLLGVMKNKWTKLRELLCEREAPQRDKSQKIEYVLIQAWFLPKKIPYCLPLHSCGDFDGVLEGAAGSLSGSC